MKTFLKWIKWIFTPIALGFFGYYAWNSHELFLDVLKSAQTEYLLLTVLILFSYHLIIALVSSQLLITVGAKIPYWKVYTIHVNRLPARYIPGGIWHTVGRMIDFHSYRVKPKQMTYFVLLESLIAPATAFLISGLLIWQLEHSQSTWNHLALLAFIGSLIGLLIVPIMINRRDKLSYKHYFFAILFFIPQWIFLTLAFYLYLKSFPSIFNQFNYIEISSVFIFSWGVGFMAFFAPQGIGIFEVVAGDLLTHSLTLGNMAVLLAGFRIMSLIGDLCLWLLVQITHNTTQ